MSERSKLKLIGIELDERKEQQLHILADDRMDRIQQGREYLRIAKEINLLRRAYNMQKSIAFAMAQ